MEYKYSTVVDPSTYQTEGLCEGIPLRLNKNSDREDVGTIRCQEDWKELVSDIGDYRGGMGPKYSFMSVSVPECSPDRLEIISYANEFAFLHDDVTDNVDQEKGDIANDEMMEAFREGATKGSIESKDYGKKQIQSKMLLEMLSIDRERALTTMKAWATFVELASGRQHHTRFATLDEYIPYRVIDVGEMFWFGMVTFGMAITIPEDEIDLCRRLMRPAWVTAGLTNDLYSWEKEYEASLKNGQPDVVNAVWVLMGEHNLTIDEAKDLCREKIKESVAEYVQLVKDNKDNPELSEDLRRYLEAMLYSLSGNVVWSLRCPRYHERFDYNELQLFRMKYGTSKSAEYFNKGGKWPQELDPVIFVSDDHPAANPDVLVEPKSYKTRVHPQTDGPAPEPKNGPSAKTTNGVSKSTRPLASVARAPSLGSEGLVLQRKLPQLSSDVVNAPYQYLASLPSKGVRDQAVDGLNIWVKAPVESLKTIKSVINILHGASLMMDDFEDDSPLRRGRPSTHEIFGAAQTINAANYQIIEALDEVQKLDDPSCLDIFIEEMKNLYVGQSFDLYWTYNVECPSVAEYLKMVDNKTGGLFCMLARLMMAQSTEKNGTDLCGLTTLLGRFFQIRDDYQNLVSADSEPQNMKLRSVLLQRRVAGKSTFEHKQLVLEQLKRTGSLTYTAGVLKTLHAEISHEIGALEKASGLENFSMRLLLDMLKV
ncbi:MAG: hypothetical protein M1814_002822 [Vezdaea aestivalis]|nr:MAG: hypothetical protein M1814_002822 [Vezdaea aestivalis]